MNVLALSLNIAVFKVAEKLEINNGELLRQLPCSQLFLTHQPLPVTRKHLVAISL